MSRKRNSPRKHVVKPHTRKGKKVGSYVRGTGTSKKTPIVKHTKMYDNSTKMGPKAFTVNFSYNAEETDGETVIVIADSYDAALDEAYEERVDNRNPYSIEIIDPDLKAVLSFVSNAGKKVGGAALHAAQRGSGYALKGIKSASSLGGKYAIKAAKGGVKVGKVLGKGGYRVGRALGKASYKTSKKVLSDVSKVLLSEAEKRLVQEVLKDCYSNDPAKRQGAIFNLKKNYPQVYEICSFSNDNTQAVLIDDRSNQVQQSQPSQIYIDARPRR